MAAGSESLTRLGNDPGTIFHRTGNAFFYRLDDIGTRGMVASHMKFIAAIAATTLIISTTPAIAVEYKGICYFNNTSMQCTVRQNPYTMTMIWADGIVEIYSYQGDGIFVDKRGGIWRRDPNNERYMVHKNGNRIGFYEFCYQSRSLKLYG